MPSIVLCVVGDLGPVEIGKSNVCLRLGSGKNVASSSSSEITSKGVLCDVGVLSDAEAIFAGVFLGFLVVFAGVF